MPSRPRAPRTAFVFLSCLIGAGCAGLGQKPVPPEVRLEGVQLIEAGLGSQHFRLLFEAVNPNGFPLPVRSIDYTLRLAGQPFASGSAAESFTLPADGNGNFSLDVRTDLVKSASMLSALVFRDGRREIDYELAGSLGVNIPLTRALTFRETGRVLLYRP